MTNKGVNFMKSRSQRSRRRRGFTLMEVLLVLAILIVLGATVTVGYQRIAKNARVDAARNQVKMLENAVNTYALAVGTPPTTQQGLAALIEAPSDLRNPAKWQGPYLEKALPNDPWDNPYQYEQQGGDQFRIWSMGPDGASGSEDDIANIQ
jgi:general secretion pathway protein G